MAKGFYSSFVVKIWCDEDDGTMRGHIRHVSTQEYAHFDDLANMDRFILDHLGSSPVDSITKGTAEADSAVLADYPGGGIAGN